MASKLIYVDNTSTGSFHEMFNASSLKMFSEIYGEVIYYASETVKENTFNNLYKTPINITHKYIPVINSKNRISNYLFAITAILTSCFILIKSNKKDVLFFNNTVIWSFLLHNFLCKILKRKVIFMFHGDLEYLYEPASPLNSFSMKVLEKIKQEKFTTSKDVYFCVLGESIKKNLKKYVSTKFYEKTISFEHSYIFREHIKSNKIDDSIIRVGHLGELRKGKLFVDNLFKFSNSLNINKKFKFYSIGRILYDKDILKRNGIEIISDSNERRLSRLEMDEAISMLDYIVFLYPKEGYKLRASGALYDAIDCEKPILLLKNDYFENIISEHKDIGCLFENENEIVDYLKNVKKSNKILNFKIIKQKLGPKSLGLKFKKELEKIDFL
jgi:extradiol dioxygenase family protein